jgi:hypothetical protein
MGKRHQGWTIDAGIIGVSRAVGLLAERQLNDQPDTFKWKWDSSGLYTASSTYRAFFFGLTEQLGARQLWKIKAPNKCRFFLYLVMHGRCWTSERRHQHGLQNHDIAFICSQEPESLDHLLMRCVYSREVWFIQNLRLAGIDPRCPSIYHRMVASCEEKVD